MKAKISAVEWLVDMLDIDKNDSSTKDVIQQAKQMEKQKKIDFGKRCFYKGFEKAESDDANCFTAWREEVEELLTFKSE